MTFIKLSLEWYKTLHVRISLIICVMDHCFIARTELRGVFTRSVSICTRHGQWYSWWSGRYDIQKQSFKLMIIICLCVSSSVKVWHFLCEELLNTKVMPLTWILLDWSYVIRRLRVICRFSASKVYDPTRSIVLPAVRPVRPTCTILWGFYFLLHHWINLKSILINTFTWWFTLSELNSRWNKQ